MTKRAFRDERYIVELNDMGCGFMIRDTQSSLVIDAPAEETVNLCLAEMNRLAAEISKLKEDRQFLAKTIESILPVSIDKFSEEVLKKKPKKNNG